MTRVTFLHNYYSSAQSSGENGVFEAELSMLKRHDHPVSCILRHSDSLISRGLPGILQGGIMTPWNFGIKSVIDREISDFAPDVFHVHNTFPLISPSVFHAIGKRAARVLTLHNYRIYCPAAILMREGAVCTECLDEKSAWPSLKHGCYKSSRLRTLPLAASVALHRYIETWSNQVDAFIVLSEFQRRLMIKAGLPEEKVHIKPNFYPGEPRVVPWESRSRCIVFVGRLSSEKGLLALINAWRLWGREAPELKIIGEGDMRADLELMAKGLQITFLGQVSSNVAQSEIASASLLVVPSEWFEGFPLVVREAFAFGTPVAVSNIGALSEIVNGDNGVFFSPGNPLSILSAVRSVWSSGDLKRLGEGARKSYELIYTEEANYASLMSIYEKAFEVSRGA